MEKFSVNKLDFKINHRNWEEALATAFAFLISASPGEVVSIVGPSRGGKTRLILELCKLLFGESFQNSNAYMPAVVVDAVNSGPNGTFSTKAFMIRMLEAIHHPLVWTNNEEVNQKIDRITEHALRGMLERGFISRKTQFLFIDEAHHAEYANKGAVGAQAVLDSWKCLAKSANIVLVIVGAYPILNILQNSPHLLGRKHQVHLPRYLLTENDLNEFAAIVNDYEACLTICPTLGRLTNCIDILYKYSLGCIGLLRSWLTRAGAKASITGNGITKSILLEVRLSDDDLASIEKEILTGEALLLKSSGSSSVNKTQSSASTVKKGNKKPFQRNPKRMHQGNRTEIQE